MGIAVNRYTKITPNKYNPRSFQELMQAPAYMREQHDNANAAYAAAQTGLTNADYLDKHGKAINPEAQRIEEQINSQVNTLAKNGFTRNTTSDMLSLNKDYQKFISAKGPGGKGAAAKAALAAEKETYMVNATKGGLPADIAGLNWQDHEARYWAKFEETGNITNIDPKYGAPYISLTGEMDKKIASLGLTSVLTGGNKSEIVFDPEKGSYVETTGGKELTADNLKQLESLNTWIKNQVLNPNSDIGRSQIEQRKTIEDSMNEIKGYTDMFEKKSTESIKNRQISNFSAKKSDEGNPNNDFYTSSGKTLPIGKTYNEIKENAHKVLNNPRATPTEKIKARAYLEVNAQADEAIKSDNLYKHYKAALKPADALMDTKENRFSYSPFRKSIMKNLNTGERWDYNKVNGKYQLRHTQGTQSPYNVGIPISKKEYDILKEGSATDILLKEHEETFKNDFTKRQGFERTDIFMPYDKASTASIEALNTLKSLTTNNAKPSDISYYDGGTNKRIEVDEASSMKAMGLLQMAKPSDIVNISISKQGNIPGFTVKFTPSATDIGDISVNEDNIIEMFIPVTQGADKITGAQNAATFLYKKLPFKYQVEIQKLMKTSNLSATTDVAAIGQSSVPMGRLFPDKDSVENSQLDFKVTYKDKDNKYYTPYKIDGKSKEVMKWGDYIDFEKIESSDVEYANKLISSKALQIFAEASKFYKSTTGESLYKKYGLNNPKTARFEEALQEVRNREIKLPSTQDIYNFRGLNNN